MQQPTRLSGLVSLLLLIPFFGLAGCSGGGSGSTTDVSYSGPTAAVTLTADNATAVSSFSLAVINDDAVSADIPIALLGTVPSTTTAQSFNLLPLTRQLLGNLLDPSVQDGTSSAGVTRTVSCQDGGTLTVSSSIGDTPTAGDSVSASFNNCNESGSTLNGSVTLVIRSFSGDGATPPWSFALVFRMDQLRVTVNASGATSILHGGYTVRASDDSTTASVTLSGTSLIIIEPGKSHWLRNFSFDVDVDDATSNVSAAYDYKISSTVIGGTITVATTERILLHSGAANPYDGTLVITGKNDAKIRLSAIDETYVMVEYDIVPPDGVYEASTTMTWAELKS